MTKRLTIALVAVALFVLLAVMPVSAVTTTNLNGTVIETGATVFIGEENLNLTHALNGATTGGISDVDAAPGNLTLGWWASAAAITTSAPTKSISLAGNRYYDFTVAQADFVGYTGNWYLLASDGQTAQTGTGATPVAVINVQDPTLSVAVWDFQQSKDITGMSITQGQNLGVQINTNMYTASQTTKRNNTIWSGNYGNMVIAPEHKTNATNGTWEFTSSNAPAVYSTLVSGMASGVTLVVQHNGTTQLMTYNNANAPLGAWNYSYWNATGISATVGSFNKSASGLGDAGEIGLWNQGTTNLVAGNVYNVPLEATDGFINVFVKDEAGAKYTNLYINGYGSVAQSTQNLFPTGSPFFFGSATNYWVTDYVDGTGQYAYPVGTYSVWAESVLNNMKDNYKNNGADYTGKTVSAVGTVTLVSDTVKIEANKDSVVRSKSFSVTVTGKPATNYTIWVKDTNSMDSEIDNQPPMIQFNQEKVYMDDPTNAAAGTHPIGDYRFENGATGDLGTVWGNVASGGAWSRTRYYANISTSSSGTRTVEFVTTNWTKAQKYTIHVEAYIGGDYKSDEVDINVEKGAVTIVAAGDQSYYLGEEIKLSGTNTETYKTYLFLVGPNLPTKGAVIGNADPRNAYYGDSFGDLEKASKGVINNDVDTFKVADVKGDNTWSWKWGTANYALDAGTYTIYAVSQPYDKESLENSAYGTVSIIIKKPFVSATASQSTVAKGDKIFITGTAEGDPGTVQIWIMGKNFANKYSTSVNSDSSFKYEVKQETTKIMSSGQYFVVVQHPMQNKAFDVDLVGNNVVNKQLNVAGETAGTQIFKLLGSGSLQGSDAAEALAEGINDANVDDTYTKLQFLIEEPTITIDTIGDKHVGDKFTITAKTNLAVDDEVLVQVYSSSFKPTMKSQSGEFSGATGTIKVTKGDSGYNKLSFDVDSSTFKPDEYIVTEEAVLQTATGTALFNVLETSVKTVAPTAVVTAAPTSAQTAAPTAVQTAVPTATATKSPGFGALVALIGLGAVAFIVVRRH